MYLISAMFRTIFFFPSAIRLFSFSRRELLSSPSTMRPSSPTTVTPSTSLFFIFTVMLAPPSPMTGQHGESRSRTRARKPICPEKHTSGDDLRRLHKVPAARGSCLSGSKMSTLAPRNGLTSPIDQSLHPVLRRQSPGADGLEHSALHSPFAIVGAGQGH